MPPQISIAVRDPSHIGAVRRAAGLLATEARLDETLAGRVAIVATELATNTLKHGGGGQLLLQRLTTQQGDSVELIAVDAGPGMVNVTRCLEDGYSTIGTSGNGLGAVRRLASEFDVYSQSPGGTLVFARIGAVRSSRPGFGVEWGVVCLPVRLEVVCGDGWSLSADDQEFSLVVADGLGHGPEAGKAATAATKLFAENPRAQPSAYLTLAHQALSGTRGAAAAAARLTGDRRSLSYAGVGNISGTLIASGKRRGLLSHNGTVGVQVRKIQEVEYPLEQEVLLVMHSDGLQSRWNLDHYPGLLARHPALIAGLLHRDFSRGRDDVTVVVARIC